MGKLIEMDGDGQKHGETYRNGRRRTEMDMNEHKFTKTKKETDRN